MPRLCCTKEPDLQKKKEIVNHIKTYRSNQTKEITSDPITIKVIYHICYNDSKEDIERDISNSLTKLNDDFNMTSSNFNNGENVFPNKSFIKLYPYLTPKKIKRFRPSALVRRNRRLYIRALRAYRIYRANIIKYNRNIIRINTRRRNLNNQLLKNAESLHTIYEKYVALAGNPNINFILDKYVIATPQTVSSDNLDVIDQQVKINGSPISPGDEYALHIWVVNFVNNLLGYAQFPWDYENNASTDGVLIGKDTFQQSNLHPDYNLGKTLSHEVGHWLGIYHVFQQSFSNQEGTIDTNQDNVLSVGETTGDLVNDTPPQLNPTYGNPYETKVWPTSTINGKTYYNMIMNFMDYSDDINLFMFTQEQCSKIRQLLAIYRSNFCYEKNVSLTRYSFE